MKNLIIFLLYESDGSQESFSFIAELSHVKRASRPLRVRKWSNLPIRENLIITWPYTDRATIRPHHRHTNVK